MVPPSAAAPARAQLFFKRFLVAASIVEYMPSPERILPPSQPAPITSVLPAAAPPSVSTISPAPIASFFFQPILFQRSPSFEKNPLCSFGVRASVFFCCRSAALFAAAAIVSGLFLGSFLFLAGVSS